MEINGMKVVDAKKSLMLDITALDVKKGDNKNPSSCAAALCCMRTTAATEARVHVGRTYIRVGNKWLRYLTSRALRAEIIVFDRGGQFQPGEYALLKCVTPGKQQGSKTNQTKKKKKVFRKVAQRMTYHSLTGVRHHGAVR